MVGTLRFAHPCISADHLEAHLRTASVAPSGVASKTGDASTAWMCSAPVPELRKPCLRPAGTISDWPAETTMRSSSSHISASPSRTVSTSSTGCEGVGAPVPGAIHCSKMHNCAAPLLAETSMRVSTPGRHCSGGMSLLSTTIIERPFTHRDPRPLSRRGACPGCCRARKRCAADPGSTSKPGSRLSGAPPKRRCTASGTRCAAWAIRTRVDQSRMELPMSPSSQKVVLVTGAARGIGLAVAKRFLAEGWRVALLDIEAELLWKSVEALAASGNTLGLHCDVSDANAVASAVTEIERRFGRLDALVNNAGIAVFAPLLETSDDDWSRVLEVNLTGPFLCCKAAVPLMREHGGGAIVNITSISAVRASTLRSAYGTSKAGLAHLTKQLAVELAALGIRVNGVAPGPVETAMAKAVHTPEIRADYHDAIPLNRYGLEEELAEAVYFLCSDRSSYITGQILAVDGGFDAAGIGLPTLRGERRNG